MSKAKYYAIVVKDSSGIFETEAEFYKAQEIKLGPSISINDVVEIYEPSASGVYVSLKPKRENVA